MLLTHEVHKALHQHPMQVCLRVIVPVLLISVQLLCNHKACQAKPLNSARPPDVFGSVFVAGVCCCPMIDDYKYVCIIVITCVSATSEGFFGCMCKQECGNGMICVPLTLHTMSKCLSTQHVGTCQIVYMLHVCGAKCNASHMLFCMTVNQIIIHLCQPSPSRYQERLTPI